MTDSISSVVISIFRFAFVSCFSLGRLYGSRNFSVSSLCSLLVYNWPYSLIIHCVVLLIVVISQL